MVAGLQTMKAQEAYAVLSSDGKTVTFYYDGKKSSRGGMDINNVPRSIADNNPNPYGTATKAVFDATFDAYRPTSTRLWFTYCTELTTISGMEYLHTDDVKDMSLMFRYCLSLTTLDLSSFNTRKVTDMGGMFEECRNLTSLDLSSFNTAKVTEMGWMFYNNSALTTIYVGSGWSTESVAGVREGEALFWSCYKLVGGNGTTYDASHIDKEYARIDKPGQPGYFTAGSEPVQERSAYAELSTDGKTLTFYYDTQRDARTGTTYDLNSGNDYPEWNSQRSNITTVVFDASFKDACPTSTYRWFSGMSKLASITGMKENLNTSEVTNMQRMFEDCQSQSLTSLDVSGFNTANVTDMSRMFYYCTFLPSLDVSHFNTANVTNMQSMFEGCMSLTSLDVSGFNTANAANMSGMFIRCMRLTSLDVSSFNTEKVTTMSNMFHYCSGLTSLDVSNFDTRNVTDMSSMFYYSSKLKTIYVGAGWSLDNVKSSDNMFYNCTSLVGGKGTVFDKSHTDATYAHPDGGTDNPGYFTYKSLTGDTNLDGTVDIADAVSVLNAMAGESVAGNADVNGDGEVNIADFVTVLNIMAGE